jgi:hypothetical protein
MKRGSLVAIILFGAWFLSHRSRASDERIHRSSNSEVALNAPKAAARHLDSPGHDEQPRQVLPLDLAEDEQPNEWIVATPACGYAMRDLTLPERHTISPEYQDLVKQALELLRVRLVAFVGKEEKLDEADDVDGVVGSVRVRWSKFSMATQESLL